MPKHWSLVLLAFGIIIFFTLERLNIGYNFFFPQKKKITLWIDLLGFNTYWDHPHPLL